MFKILIAEDDVELRGLFQNVLIKRGYQVKGVSNGKEALEALDGNFYDLVISDIMMPIMDGYQLVRTLRDHGYNTPVMMITAKDAFEDMQLGFLSGSDDYMVKPINVNEMVLRVSALLRRAQMTNERKQVIGNTILEIDSLIASSTCADVIFSFLGKPSVKSLPLISIDISVISGIAQPICIFICSAVVSPIAKFISLLT